jgi:hypothetical protein
MGDERVGWAPRTLDQLCDRIAKLDVCDSYVVVVLDPLTGEADAHGPYQGAAAICAADRSRRELDSGGLADVQVKVTRLHPPESCCCPEHP